MRVESLARFDSVYEQYDFIIRPDGWSTGGSEVPSFNASTISGGTLKMAIVNDLASAVPGQSAPMTLFMEEETVAVFFWDTTYCQTTYTGTPDWDSTDSWFFDTEVMVDPHLVFADFVIHAVC